MVSFMRSADKADLLQHYREFSPLAASVVITRWPCEDQGIYTMGRWRDPKTKWGERVDFVQLQHCPRQRHLLELLNDHVRVEKLLLRRQGSQLTMRDRKQKKWQTAPHESD